MRSSAKLIGMNTSRGSEVRIKDVLPHSLCRVQPMNTFVSHSRIKDEFAFFNKEYSL